MLIDTHCHLTDDKLFGNLEDILSKAKESDVERIIVPTVGVLDAKKAIKIASTYENVWAMVGVHPEVLADELNPEYRDEWLAAEGDWLRSVTETAESSDRVIGIGEIGLDFHYDKNKTSKDLQIKIFKGQLEVAIRLDLPVAIHMRDSESEMLQVLTSASKLPPGQFHCWAGSDDLLSQVIEMGFYVSFCGNITYPNSETLRNQAQKVPIDRLLLETDSPYLTPIPLRGSQNVPSNVKILAEYLANLLDLSTETLINQTTKNAKCLYFGG